jgi:hypothetical protein
MKKLKARPAATVLLLLVSFWLLAGPAEGSWGSYDAGSQACGGAPESNCFPPYSAALRQQICGPRENRSRSTFAALLPRFLASRAGDFALPISTSVRRVALDENPTWVISAAWARGETQLIMADVKGRSLVTYDLAGRMVHHATIAGNAQFFPVAINKSEAGYMIRNQAMVMSLDDGLSRLETLYSTAEGPSGQETEALTYIYGWAPFENNLLLFGDLRTNRDAWSSGIVRVSRNNANCLQVMHRMAFTEQARRYFQIGYPMMASVNSNGYALIMDDSPHVIEVGVETRRLKAFPGRFARRPAIPSVRSDSLAGILELATRSEIAAGLVGWRDRLYILTREPAARGATRWSLWRLHPQRDALDSAPLILPTTAEHVIVVPGERHWAIIEKGPVVSDHVAGDNSQLVSSMVLVDAAYFSPVAGPSKQAGEAPSRGASAGVVLMAAIDAWRRRVVGWTMATHLRTELVLEAFNMALGQRRYLPAREL